MEGCDVCKAYAQAVEQAKQEHDREKSDQSAQQYIALLAKFNEHKDKNHAELAFPIWTDGGITVYIKRSVVEE